MRNLDNFKGVSFIMTTMHNLKINLEVTCIIFHNNLYINLDDHLKLSIIAIEVGIQMQN